MSSNGANSREASKGKTPGQYMFRPVSGSARNSLTRRRSLAQHPAGAPTCKKSPKIVKALRLAIEEVRGSHIQFEDDPRNTEAVSVGTANRALFALHPVHQRRVATDEEGPPFSLRCPLASPLVPVVTRTFPRTTRKSESTDAYTRRARCRMLIFRGIACT